MKKKYPFGGKKLDFHINIKKKSFINPHDKTSIDVLKNINIKIKSKEFVFIILFCLCPPKISFAKVGTMITHSEREIRFFF